MNSIEVTHEKDLEKRRKCFRHLVNTVVNVISVGIGLNNEFLLTQRFDRLYPMVEIE